MSRQNNSTKCVDQKICKVCDKVFISHHHNSAMCSIECKRKHKRFRENDARRKASLLKYPDSSDPYTYCECKICGFRSYDLGTHPLAHDISVEEYITRYGTTKSNLAIDNMTGDKNPSYGHGGKLSPWSEKSEFHTKEQIKDAKERASKNSGESYWNTNKNPFKREYHNSDKEYSLSQTRDLKWFIDKYGEEDGKVRYSEKISKWMKNFKKQNFSAISQELFNMIIEQYTGNMYYATYDRLEMQYYTNKEYRLKLNDGRIILPDFIDIDKKKIIEFDGDYWHSGSVANPSKEKDRDLRIKNSGYDVLHIKEYDFKKDREKTLQKCLNYLNN